jgi:hypothetical protein
MYLLKDDSPIRIQVLRVFEPLIILTGIVTPFAAIPSSGTTQPQCVELGPNRCPRITASTAASSCLAALAFAIEGDQEKNPCLAASILVNALRAFPIKDICQFPGILGEFDFKLAVLVESKLALWIQYARALFLVGVVQINLSAREIEGR